MSTFKWDNKGLKEVNKAMEKSLVLMGHGIRRRVRNEMIVPRRLGTLQNEAFSVDDSRAAEGEVRLVFDTPYARRLYFHPEYNFSKDENPNAQGEWMKPWLAGGKYEKVPAELFKALLEKELK